MSSITNSAHAGLGPRDDDFRMAERPRETVFRDLRGTYRSDPGEPRPDGSRIVSSIGAARSRLIRRGLPCMIPGPGFVSSSMKRSLGRCHFPSTVKAVSKGLASRSRPPFSDDDPDLHHLAVRSASPRRETRPGRGASRRRRPSRKPGRRERCGRVPVWLWRSISWMPAAKAKFPSRVNGR